ncbi:Transcriptional regulator, TetR family protein [Minicystis rosea]|nr:Transcriptional regulator, TetR family protein [Minicystis rosea]
MSRPREAPAPATGMREKKKARTREAIVQAALELFEKKGFDATTVEEIAAAADISTRTLFRYFTSKEDVIFLGQDEENARAVEMLRTRPEGEAPLDTLFRGTRILLDTSRDTLKHAQRGLAIVQRTPALRARRQQVLNEIQDIIATGLAGKRATKTEALRMRLLAAAYLAALNEAMVAWITSGAKGDPSAQIDLVEDLLRNGFR